MTLTVTLIRRAKSLLWTALSILIISAAVLVGIGKLLLPYSDRYQPRLEAWLSEEFGRPVVLDSFAGEWTAFGPRLSLRGMRLLPRDRDAAEDDRDRGVDLVIESAALDIRPLNLLLPGSSLYNFRIIGADFELLRYASGEFRLSGFGMQERGSEAHGSALQELVRVGEVVLQDSSLAFRDERVGVSLDFRDVNGRLQLQGDELASEISAALFDDRSELILGEVEGTVLVSLDQGQAIRGVEWQGTAREFMLAAFQGRLPRLTFLPLTGWLNAELWGSWSQDEGHAISGAADLAEARFTTDQNDLWLNRVNTRFQWQFSSGSNWSLHLADLLYEDAGQAWTAPRVSMARDAAKGLGLWLSTDQLPLSTPLQLARIVMSNYGSPWPVFLPQTASGTVLDFDLVLDDDWQPELLRGRVQRGGVSGWSRWPGLEGLDAEFDIRRNGGAVKLSGDSVRLDWPYMFRDPIEIALTECRADLGLGRPGWQLGISGCALANADLAAHGEAVIRGNTGRPAIDVNLAVTRGDAGQLDSYWPEAALGAEVKRWLRRGLVGGRIDQGRVSIHGDLDDWPFRQGRGRFEAVAWVSDGELDYFDGWPNARDVSAVARFVGVSMEISGQAGEIGGVEGVSARVGISDFARPVLAIDYQANGEVPTLLGFLRRTPLLDQTGRELERFTFGGQADTRGSITLPFARLPEGLAVEGDVRLSDGTFRDPDSDTTVSDIRGNLTYSENGFRASALQAGFRGRPARLDLRSRFAGDEVFRASLTGTFAPDELLPASLVGDAIWLQGIQGECPWRLAVSVSKAPDKGVGHVMLDVTSDLDGVALELPAPLNKGARESWPLSLSYPLGGPEQVLQLELRNRVVVLADLAGGLEAPRSAVVRVGGSIPTLPPQGSLRVEGQADTLDLDGWIDLVSEQMRLGGSLGGLALEWGDFTARELTFLDRSFSSVGLQLNTDESGLDAEFSSADLKGSVRFTAGTDSAGSLTAEFERLALGEPMSSGVDMDTDPGDWPALHLFVQSLRYGEIEMGETRIEAFPVANGLRFDKIDAASDRLQMQASGEWLLDEQGHRSDFDIHFAAESLGNLLQSLNIESPVQGGQTLVDCNAWWYGPPAAFELKRLNGALEFSVVDGNITSASAGGGRLLGLLSVQALPRRLALDFRDVFDSGFAFDEAAGTFQMQNGIATTDNVLLRSAAANISISGSTDLVARKYDQVLTVRPGVGNTLPVIGALAAGPGGAAAGLALQGLLQESLAEATRVQYSVTGSWEEPIFETIQVEHQKSQGEAAR